MSIAALRRSFVPWFCRHIFFGVFVALPQFFVARNGRFRSTDFTMDVRKFQLEYSYFKVSIYITLYIDLICICICDIFLKHRIIMYHHFELFWYWVFLGS